MHYNIDSLSCHNLVTMRFEKFLPYHVSECIKLSEQRLQREQSSTQQRLYLTGLRALMTKMKQETQTLMAVPLFTWNGTNSTCWLFEEFHAMFDLQAQLLSEARSTHASGEFKATKALLTEAVQLSYEMLGSNWHRTPYVKCMPELHVFHLVSKLFAVKSLYYYNMHTYKSTPAAIKKAYQLTEISNRLWRRTANTPFEHKLQIDYHFASAVDTADFQQKLSHVVHAQQLVDTLKLEDRTRFEEVEALCTSTLDINSTVHYISPLPITCPLLSVTEALAAC